LAKNLSFQSAKDFLSNESHPEVQHGRALLLYSNPYRIFHTICQNVSVAWQDVTYFTKTLDTLN